MHQLISLNMARQILEKDLILNDSLNNCSKEIGTIFHRDKNNLSCK